MEIPPRNTPPRGEKFPRQSTKPTPRPKKGLATTQKSLGSVAAIPVTEPPKQHRRIFMIGSERIRRVASAARKSVPNPQFSKSPYAYIIEDNMDENIKPTSATLDMWRDWLIFKKVTKGDIVIVDALTSPTWVEHGYSDDDIALDEPHGKNPIPIGLKHNSDLKEAVECIANLAKLVQLPVIFFVTGPMPRYLHEPCCNEPGHMVDWSNDTPDEVMTEINKVDAELKAYFNPRANISYISARKLAESALTSKLVSLKPLEGEDQHGSNPLKIWQQITSPGNQFMTAQGGKLIWSKAVKNCTEERFLAALEEVYLHMGYHPEDKDRELKLYEAKLRRIAFGKDELELRTVKKEQIDINSSIDMDNSEIVELK